MIENKSLFVGDKRITELEQTLIENMSVYKDLIDRINSIQPELCLTAILKENICSVIGDLECFKQGGGLIDYEIGWAKNTLRVIAINLRKEFIILNISLIRKRLFHESFTNNIKIRVIGVRKW